MEIIKNQLTFAEAYSAVQDIADSCFLQDEEGNDIDYSPATKSASTQVVFVENYTDYVFETPEITDDEVINKQNESEVFDKNYANYMSICIEDYTRNSDKDVEMFNQHQWDSILKSADELISFRKQKLLNSISNQKNEALTTLVSELVQKEINNQELQKRVLEQTEQINSQYTKEEVLAVTNTFAELNKLSSNPEYLKAVAGAVHNDKNIKRVKTPTDHKKTKKTNKTATKSKVASISIDKTTECE